MPLDRIARFEKDLRPDQEEITHQMDHYTEPFALGLAMMIIRSWMGEGE